MISNLKAKRLIRHNVYNLKRNYGYTVDIYRNVDGIFNPQTGRTQVQQTKIHIRRAILFPSLIHRDFFQSISFIKANSNFVQGGDVQINDRQVIIDNRDLPLGYQIQVNDYLFINRKRYDIKSRFGLEDVAQYLVLRAVEQSAFPEISEGYLRDELKIYSCFEIPTGPYAYMQTNLQIQSIMWPYNTLEDKLLLTNRFAIGDPSAFLTDKLTIISSFRHEW